MTKTLNTLVFIVSCAILWFIWMRTLFLGLPGLLMVFAITVVWGGFAVNKK